MVNRAHAEDKSVPSLPEESGTTVVGRTGTAARQSPGFSESSCLSQS